MPWATSGPTQNPGAVLSGGQRGQHLRDPPPGPWSLLASLTVHPCGWSCRRELVEQSGALVWLLASGAPQALMVSFLSAQFSGSSLWAALVLV